MHDFRDLKNKKKGDDGPDWGDLKSCKYFKLSLIHNKDNSRLGVPIYSDLYLIFK